MLPGGDDNNFSINWLFLLLSASPISVILSSTISNSHVSLSLFDHLCQTWWGIWRGWHWPSVLLEWGSFSSLTCLSHSRDSWLRGVKCLTFLGFLPSTRWVSTQVGHSGRKIYRGLRFLGNFPSIPRVLKFTWLSPLARSIEPSTWKY